MLIQRDKTDRKDASLSIQRPCYLLAILEVEHNPLIGKDRNMVNGGVPKFC